MILFELPARDISPRLSEKSDLLGSNVGAVVHACNTAAAVPPVANAGGASNFEMLQPDSRGHRSYFEAFARRRNITPDVVQRESLLTDRAAYLNFLEVQLERVSAACLAAQDFGARIDACCAQACAAEGKVRIDDAIQPGDCVRVVPFKKLTVQY